MLSHSLGRNARGSERVLLRIPIRVEGKDTFGKAFEEMTHTLVVNRSGGLIAVSHLLQLGALIKITNIKTQVSCPFEVVMRAERSLSGNPEWGVKCLEPELEIWGVHFPTITEQPLQVGLIHVLLECRVCFSREMAALSVPQYNELVAQSSLPRPCAKCRATRDWKLGVIEGAPEKVLVDLPAASGSGPLPWGEAETSRERHLAVKLPLEVRLPAGPGESSTTENISESGLSFACSLEMRIGDRVFVSVGLDTPPEQHDIPARIVWRRPCQEKGRAFYGAKLERHL